jgi:hypothetical protein
MTHRNIVPLVLFFVSIGLAATTEVSPTTITGWGWLTMGRVESSPFQKADYDVNFDKEWLVDFDAGLKAVHQIGANGRGRLHLGLTTGYPILDFRKEDAEFQRRSFKLYLIDAALEQTYLFDNQTIYAEFGYFPVKYNPQAMNLGEYLFRSGTYPGYLNSGFELADKEKHIGIHVSYKNAFIENGWFKGDLYVGSDMRDYPLHDISPTLIGTASPHPVVEFSAGAMFAHLITLDERKTTPGTDTVVFKKGTQRWNNVGWVDPATGDTILYTFRGIKAMARMTLDPKSLFDFDLFGKEDAKLYGEAAVLGVKNYPGWYENIEERIPVMFGFNVPAFKILDVLAIEGEYYGFKHWNTPESVWKSRSPVPYDGKVISFYDDWEPKTDDDWKWSVYMSKKIMNRMRISAQVASDHISRMPYMPPPPSFSKYTEICPRTQDWYWMTRVMYYF